MREYEGIRQARPADATPRYTRLEEANMEFRELSLEDLWMIGQVDRSETVTAEYSAVPSADGLGLTLTRVDHDTPIKIGPWSREGIDRRIAEWTPRITPDGLVLGAFQGERLVGFTCVGPKLSDGSAELVALFIDAAWRRSGVGSVLMARSESWALQNGISALFADSNSTASAVGFYLKHGFSVIALRNNSVIRHCDGGPVMAKVLEMPNAA